MKTFQIHYDLKNGSSMVVGMIADNREQAVQTLLAKQKNVKSIKMVSSGFDIHLLTDNIKTNLLHGKEEVKKLKKEIQTLKNCLMDSDDEIESLRHKQLDTTDTSRYVNEISMLHEKIVQMEMASQTQEKSLPSEDTSALKHEIDILKQEKEQDKVLLKTLKDEISMFKDNVKDLQSQDVVLDEKFICPECLKSYKSPKGVKLHFNKMHKEGFTNG